MTFDFSSLIEKYGSKKALIVMFCTYFISTIPIPTNKEEMYFAIAQVAGTAILGTAGLFFQFRIDNSDAPITP